MERASAKSIEQAWVFALSIKPLGAMTIDLRRPSSTAIGATPIAEWSA